MVDRRRPRASLGCGPHAGRRVRDQQGPDQAGVRVRQGASRAVLAPSGEKGAQPPPPVVSLRLEPAARGPGAMNQHGTTVHVPACAAAEQPWRATACGCPRDSSPPGGQLAAVCERGRRPHRRDEGGGRPRPEPRAGRQPLACGLGRPDGDARFLVRSQAVLHGAKRVVAWPAARCAQRVQCGLFLLPRVRAQCTQRGDAWWQDHAIRVQQPPELIAQWPIDGAAAGVQRARGAPLGAVSCRYRGVPEAGRCAPHHSRCRPGAQGAPYLRIWGCARGGSGAVFLDASRPPPPGWRARRAPRWRAPDRRCHPKPAVCQTECAADVCRQGRATVPLAQSARRR